MKKYQPSNGTEGTAFIEDNCMRCEHCDPNPEGEKQCEILARALGFDVNDKDYPEEWQYHTELKKPICTAYKFWNWEASGPPPEPEIVDPNQISIFDEIENLKD